jgi:hypothetical protein
MEISIQYFSIYSYHFIREGFVGKCKIIVAVIQWGQNLFCWKKYVSTAKVVVRNNTLDSTNVPVVITIA